MRWVLAQPDDALSVGAAFAEYDQVHYSLGDEKYVTDPWPGMLVKKEMNVVLENIAHALKDELGVALDEYFGTDTENWNDIDLATSIRMVIAQASSRFTVGVPFCEFGLCFQAIPCQSD
jgi:hypothetical protein